MSNTKFLQDGGFMMSDKVIPSSGSGESLYSIMEKHFNTQANKTFFESVLQQKGSPPNNDLSFLEKSPYTDIYTKLIDLIMTDAVYTQTFEYNDGITTYKHKGMHNYHIQLCALMTMSFLFELELFSVVHNYIPINIDNETRNRLPSTYAHSKHETTTPLRQYKNLVTNGLDAMLKYFTESLDKFFNNFMNQLLVKIEKSTSQIISQKEILEAIVPINSKTPPHVNGKFDYIYVDWKDRIKEKIKKKLTTGYSDADDKTYSICINAAIEDALDEVERGGSTYIAEGTGFFSFLYLRAANSDVVYNGSCITYSMLELYIMARLHVHANNLILEMESEHPERAHEYWKSVQTDENIKLPSVTHWTTQYNFQSYPLHFRHVFSNSIRPPTLQHSFNFVDPDKPKLCLLLLYPIFDSYIRYIDQPEAGSKLYPTESAKILPFIRSRIQFVKTLFRRKTTSIHTERGNPTQKSDPVAKVDPIPATWFNNVFGFDENAANFATTHKDSFHVKKNPKPAENEHILMTVKTKEIDVGVFRYRSVEELLKDATDNPSARSVFGFDSTTNLKYLTMTSPAHTVHMNPSYSGSIFQVASQFNALEMAGPELTPQNGITNYVNDHTQGPVCAMVCPFGTLYRNYFCMPDVTGKQPEDKSVNGNPQTGTAAGGTDPENNQINTLTELMKTEEFKNLRFQNGYVFVNDKDQLTAINKYLSTPENFWKAMMAIKYVIQEDTPVVNVAGDGKIMDHIVSQIYCSAYPVAYDPLSVSREDYYLLSSMILHAVYYSTLAYAVTRITPDEPRKKVFLTRVGGGAFKNEDYIIDTAIYNAVRHFIAYPIDVYIVNYKMNDKSQAEITDPKKIDGPLASAIVTTKPILAFTNSRPYIDIQTMLDKKATDETEKVKKATDEMVTKIKKETESRSKTSIGKKEKLDDNAKLEEKAKKRKEEKIHEEKLTKKRLKLTQAIEEAIKTFSASLEAGGGNEEYIKILKDLVIEINKDREARAKVDAEADSKGTQQLNFINIDLDAAHRDNDLENEDKPAKYLSTGLSNGGSYCYLNSAFQLLFSAEPLRTWIKSQPKLGDAENTIESNTIQLLKMMVESSDPPPGSKRTVDGKEFKDKIEKLIASTSKGDNRFKIGGQNDSHEVLVPILDALKEKKPDSVNSLKFREFVRHTKGAVVSIPSNENREKCVTGMLPITDDEITSIQNALNNYIRPTEGKVDEDGGKVTINTQIQLQFEDSNQYFILCLNRTSFDNTGKKTVMNKKKITVDRKITVSQTYDTRGKSITEKNYKFKLRGAILKSGTAGGGHFKYISFENGPTNEPEPITYNDRNVYVSKPDELSGEYSIENNSYIFLYEKDEKDS